MKKNAISPTLCEYIYSSSRTPLLHQPAASWRISMYQASRMRLLKIVINLYNFIRICVFSLHPDDLVFAGVALTQTLHPQFSWPVAPEMSLQLAILLCIDKNLHFFHHILLLYLVLVTTRLLVPGILICDD